MDVLNSIKESISTLNEIEEYHNGLADKLSVVDNKINDLLHYVENNNLKTNECYRMIREIKKQREIRRKIKNDYQLLNCYKSNELKLSNTDNRKMLLSELCKVEKRLNQPYKNRNYTDEELNNILGKESKEELGI